MDRELAQMVVSSAIRAMIELVDLAPLIKEHGDAAKDEAIKLTIGSANLRNRFGDGFSLRTAS
jgi:hypothetical protein